MRRIAAESDTTDDGGTTGVIRAYNTGLDALPLPFEKQLKLFTPAGVATKIRQEEVKDDLIHM